MTETSGVLPHLYLSSKKISPVEVELPPTGIAPNTVCVSSTEGTAGRQDPVEAPSHEESGERSAELEGLGAAGSLARGGDSEDVASQGKPLVLSLSKHKGYRKSPLCPEGGVINNRSSYFSFERMVRNASE